MSQAQVFAKNVRNGAQEFFRVKTREEDFGAYLPINSRLPPARVRAVAFSTVALGGRKFKRSDYEQEPVRGARARV